MRRSCGDRRGFRDHHRSGGAGWRILLAVKPVRRRTAVVAAAGVLVARKAAELRRLGTPAAVQTTTAPAPGPLDGATAGWTVKADGRITDLAVLPGRGEVVYVEELAHRSWRATAVDAHTG